ncbi:MAG: NapC/NirT family cytochrome c [Magnetococcales bacterium]|nr:NapC/NirT family cytochrome c [Magnetococcales bacterium]
MKFFKTKLGITAAIAAGLVLILILSWSATRFHRISVCLSCHEIFEDYTAYEPDGGLSKSVEDFNPSQKIEPDIFHVSVGCAECHAYPYEEYLESAHYENDLGVKPGCIGCHDQHSVREILMWKFFYVNTGGMGESPFHAISNSLRDIVSWEELRKELATKVRKTMYEEDSIKCKNCHKQEGKWFKKFDIHKTKKTCIQCHYNIVHKDVPWHKDTLKED